MRVKHWLLMLLAVVTVTAFAGGPTPTPAASPTPTAALTLPVLAGTPVPLPAEPITPDNVDRLQLLAMWGRGGAKQMAYSPDGRFLAVGSTAGLWLYEAETLKLLRFKLTTAPVEIMTFLPDNETIMAQAGGNTILRWNATNGEDWGSWEVGARELKSVAFGPDGKTLASALEDGQIGILEIGSGRLLRTMTGDPDDLTKSLAYSPDGALLASNTFDCVVKIWNVQTGDLWQSMQGDKCDSISPYLESNVVFSPDGQLLASVWDTKVLVWEASTGKLLRNLDGPAWLWGLSFSPDGKQLAAGSYDATVKLWRIADGELMCTITGTDRINALSFSAGGKTLGTAAGINIGLWDVETGLLTKKLEEYAGQSIISLAVGPDNTLFTGHLDGNIRQWDIASGQVVKTLPGHTSPVTKLILSTDGSTLVSGEEESMDVRIWDPVTGQMLRTFSALSLPFSSLAVSPNGQLLATGSNSSAISLFSVQTGKKLHLLSAGRRKTSDLEFSPDGTSLASSTEGQINLWQTETGKLLYKLGVGVPGFSIDGQIVFGVMLTGKISVWNMVTGELVRTIQLDTDRLLNQVSFSPDQKLVVASARNIDTARPWDVGTLHLWEAGTGHLLRVIDVPPIENLYLSPDGKLLVLHTGGTVQLWGVILK